MRPRVGASVLERPGGVALGGVGADHDVLTEEEGLVVLHPPQVVDRARDVLQLAAGDHALDRHLLPGVVPLETNLTRRWPLTPFGNLTENGTVVPLTDVP